MHTRPRKHVQACREKNAGRQIMFKEYFALHLAQCKKDDTEAPLNDCSGEWTGASKVAWERFN